MISVDEKIQHLRKLGFNGDMTEIRKAYSGQNFNPNDDTFRKVVDLSDKLCDEYTKLSSDLLNEDQAIVNRASERKEKILSILFPGKGMVFGGGDKLRAVIGFVDLDGMNYINKNVDFGKSSLCHIKTYVFLASNIKFGTDSVKINSNGSAKLDAITINEDTWICSNVDIEDGSIIGKECVVALGSNVKRESECYDSTICYGNPCQSKLNIGPDYMSKSQKTSFKRTNEEIEYLVKLVKSCGIDGNFDEYRKLCRNEKFNALNPTIIKIANYSRHLCAKYNDSKTSLLEKKKILDILFPLHGDNLEVGEDLFVDFLGITKVGDNVKIGNGAVFAGNVEIEDNVVIGENVTLQGMGHEVYYKKRRLGEDENGYPCEITIPGYIKVKEGLTLAKGTKVKPNVIVERDTENDELYLGK